MSDERLNAVPSQQSAQAAETEKITKEESERQERVLFEDDDKVMLRDGKSYQISPFGLKDGRLAVKMLNSINSAIIIDNLIEDEEGIDKYETLIEVIYMAFKPYVRSYYPHITKEYLEEYVDLMTAKKIIDIIIGLNGLKKLM